MLIIKGLVIPQGSPERHRIFLWPLGYSKLDNFARYGMYTVQSRLYIIQFSFEKLALLLLATIQWAEAFMKLHRLFLTYSTHGIRTVS